MTTPTKEEVAEKCLATCISCMDCYDKSAGCEYHDKQAREAILKALTEYSTPLEQRIAALEKVLKEQQEDMVYCINSEATRTEMLITLKKLKTQIESVLKGEK